MKTTILTLSLIISIHTYFKDQRFTFKDGKFTILQLTDLHYGEDYAKDLNSTRLVQQLIDQVNPDLIIVTGDSVSGYAWDGLSNNFHQQAWEMWTLPMRLAKKPYAYTFGNHDDQGNLSREEIVKLDMTHPYSMMNGSAVNNSNYYIPIYSSDNSTIISLLWLFDTMDEGCLGMVNTWGCFGQIQWYEEESKRISFELGYSPKGLGFFHIPIQEYMDMHNWSASYGLRGEPISCPKKNNGLFRSLLKTGNIKATFCGHDHDNDNGGVFFDVELVYGRKTGYGGYGPDYFQRGARVIVLNEDDADFSYNHFIVQEDGSVQKNGIPTYKGLFDYISRCDK
jgi:3',5'-cyclic AMP phosphodiesterase CpdA